MRGVLGDGHQKIQKKKGNHRKEEGPGKQRGVGAGAGLRPWDLLQKTERDGKKEENGEKGEDDRIFTFVNKVSKKSK